MKLTAFLTILCFSITTAAQPPVVVTQPAVVIGVPISPGFVFSVGDTDRDGRIAAEVVRQMKEMFQASVPPVEVTSAEVSRETFRISGGKKTTPEVGGADDANVLQILRSNCADCHRPGSPRPGKQIFAQGGGIFKNPDPTQEKARRRAVYEQVKSGAMPKGGTLPESEKKVLEKYFKE